MKHFTREQFLVLIFLSGMASRKRVGAHIIVRRYLWPDFVLGKGPTQSSIILLKGSSKAGFCCKGAFSIVWLGFLIDTYAKIYKTEKRQILSLASKTVQMVKNFVIGFVYT